MSYSCEIWEVSTPSNWKSIYQNEIYNQELVETSYCKKTYYSWWFETIEWDFKVINKEFGFNKSKTEEPMESDLHKVVLHSSTWGLGFKGLGLGFRV